MNFTHGKIARLHSQIRVLESGWKWIWLSKHIFLSLLFIFFSPFRSFREIKNKFSSCSANWFLYFENSNFECYYCSILFTDYFFKLWNKFSKLMQWIQITFTKKREKIYITEHIYNWTRIFNNIIYLIAFVIHISVQYVYIYVTFGRY